MEFGCVILNAKFGLCLQPFHVQQCYINAETYETQCLLCSSFWQLCLELSITSFKFIYPLCYIKYIIYYINFCVGRLHTVFCPSWWKRIQMLKLQTKQLHLVGLSIQNLKADIMQKLLTDITAQLTCWALLWFLGSGCFVVNIM